MKDAVLRLEAWRYYLRGRLAWLVRRPMHAAENYRLALRFDPGFARAARALAFLLAREGKSAEAELLLRDAGHDRVRARSVDAAARREAQKPNRK